jgi:hypothetical protein
MSGSNDVLAQMLLQQSRQQGRRQSASSRLAEQMMAGLNNPTPVYSTGATLARAGSGLLAGLMAQQADNRDQAREDEQMQRLQDRTDKRDYLDGQAAADFRIRMSGEAPAPAQPAARETAAPIQPAAAPRSQGGSWLDRLETAESSGNTSAPNRRSKAGGNFQFIDDTWRAFARANPAQFEGMDDAAILASRFDPQRGRQLGRQAAEWYAGENSRILGEQGLPNGPAEQALAHRFGPAGAAAMLRATPDTPVGTAVPNGAQVLMANPDLRGVSVGEFLTNNSARYGGQGQPAPGPAGTQYAGRPTATDAGVPGPTAPGPTAPPASPAAPGQPDFMALYLEASSSRYPQIRAMAPGLLERARQQIAQRAAAATAAERATDNARADRTLAATEGARTDAQAFRAEEARRAQENADRTVILQKTERGEAAARAAAAGTQAEDERRFNRANTLRDEVRQLTAPFRTVQTAFDNIEAAARSNTGAGDMSMLYSFVKLLDPTSVVRESEFAMAAASGSFGERVQGAAQRILTGERLPDSLRNSFLAEAQNLYTNNRRTYDRIVEQYRGIAERYGLPVEQVLPDFALPRQEPVAPPPPPPPPPPPQGSQPGMIDRAREREAQRQRLEGTTPNGWSGRVLP